METKVIHTCKAPDGTVFTRTSSSGKKYTHAVIGYDKGNNRYFAQCWNSRRDLAERERTRMQSPATVVAVEIEEKTVKPRPDVKWPATEGFTAGGVAFVKDSYYSFLGEHAGYKIALHNTGRQFRASAWSSIDSSARHIWSKGGSPNLDKVVERIVGEIEAKIAA